jgi:hypothetical protein
LRQVGLGIGSVAKPVGLGTEGRGRLVWAQKARAEFEGLASACFGFLVDTFVQLECDAPDVAFALCSASEPERVRTNETRRDEQAKSLLVRGHGAPYPLLHTL